MESIADSLPGISLSLGSLPFGLPMMGGVGDSMEASFVGVGIDKETGKVTVTGRKIGSVPVEIPVDEFPGAEAAEAVREVFSAMKAIKEGDERLEKLRTETNELREFVSFEPSRLRNALWDKFPESMGRHRIEIMDRDGALRLVVDNEEKTDVTVDPEFGQAILVRQAKLDEARETINANEKLVGETTTMVDAKEGVLFHLRAAAEKLVGKALPKGETFLGLGEKKGGKLFIVVARKINEPITEIPPEVRKRLILSHLEDGGIPLEMLEALGIKDDITNIRGILGMEPPAPSIEAPGAQPDTAEGNGVEEEHPDTTQPPADSVEDAGNKPPATTEGGEGEKET
ncbi:MAG: hypothetical protein WC619_04830 [Patescibacteria group bacterium]